jgi:Cu/Ag efflux protein CusF
MTNEFSVASQLALALAWMPALAFGGQNTDPTPRNPMLATVSIYYEAAFDDRFFQKQELTLGKDARTLAARSSVATNTAASSTLIPGRGVVLKVDRANATVTINHDPIRALDWPRMTMPFRLKESALADQVKEGDTVEFFLEKSGSDYVIVKWRK